MSLDEVVPSRIPSTSPYHEPWLLTAAEREVYRHRARAARLAKIDAMTGRGDDPIHDLNTPEYDPNDSMPRRKPNGLPALSMFSGGGGLDLGFDLAGFQHAGSYEIIDDAAATLSQNRTTWTVFGGSRGDVRNVDWRKYRGEVAVLHGGPPCQPFSNAGRQRGAADSRNMWPEFVRAVKQIMPDAFIAENVAALASSTFSSYVSDAILAPLSGSYTIVPILLHAHEFGVPQLRRRVVFFGFRTKAMAKQWEAPQARYRRPGTEDNGLPEAMGVRKALGLPDIGFDDISPTIRSGFSGPRHTTSILSSTSASRKFDQLEVWPNGVAADRESARAFVVNNGHFRLSVSDVALLQGFPGDWLFQGATYSKLGQIGNSVAPPVAYAVALSVATALASR
ncbi:MAG: DNA (cytosine-5-)-methyltransferase [Propionibacteriaceae bacterium]|nr:DNA (cytosine-5-)-methyltransferase [Propionibacteriaceae bacterium]